MLYHDVNRRVSMYIHFTQYSQVWLYYCLYSPRLQVCPATLQCTCSLKFNYRKVIITLNLVNVQTTMPYTYNGDRHTANSGSALVATTVFATQMYMCTQAYTHACTHAHVHHGKKARVHLLCQTSKDKKVKYNNIQCIQRNLCNNTACRPYEIWPFYWGGL